MFKNKLFISILFIVLTLAVTGCSVTLRSTDEGFNDLGIYKTDSMGDVWSQRVLIPTIAGKPKNMGGLSVNSLEFDPSDSNAIYLGSKNNGLFYTYDGAKNWHIASGLGQVTINAIAVDNNSKCIIYAAVDNKIYKSTDCSRTWFQAYYDNNKNVKINAIAIDYYNSANLYIGTSRGEIIKSLDRGKSWQTLYRFKNSVEKIVISSKDSRIIFVATKKDGIFRSDNSGSSWVNLDDNLKDFSNSKNFKDLIISSFKPNLILLATSYGLLRSEDNGDSWSKIELITPEKGATINAIAMSPKDALEIYYVTNNTFYRSLDGGQNWATKKLPTSGAGWKLLIDPEDTSIIYMGVKKIKK